MTDQEIEWFAPTSGRISGYLGLVAGAAILVLAVLGRAPVEYVALALLIALLSWMVLLRPRVGMRGDDLLLRGIASTVVIPVGTIEGVAVRQVLAVRAAGRRYVSAAVGHPFSHINSSRRRPRDVPAPANPGPPRYADHVADTIDRHAKQARRDGAAAGPIRREWALPELAGVTVLVVVLAVLVIV